jgi:predicted DNA-binding protein (MmcQ/YjbR family)
MGAKKKARSAGKSKLYTTVHAFALRFPEAYEEFPWGHSAIKVRKKIFVTLGEGDEGLSMSLKLEGSNFEALLLPFTEPTHYGMGKHGWVTSRLEPGKSAPLALLRSWIEESFRAVAPKKLVAALDEHGLAKAPAKRAASRKAAPAKSLPAKKRSRATKKTAARKKPGRKKA